MICSAWLKKGESKRVWVRAGSDADVSAEIRELRDDGTVVSSYFAGATYLGDGLWAIDLNGIDWDGHIFGKVTVDNKPLPFVVRYGDPKKILVYASDGMREGLSPTYKQYDYTLAILSSGTMLDVGGGFYVATDVVDTKSLLCVGDKKCVVLHGDQLASDDGASAEDIRRCLAKVKELQDKNVSLEEALRECLDRAPDVKIDSYTVSGPMGAREASKVESELHGKIKTDEAVRIKTGDASTIKTADKASIRSKDSSNVKAKD